MMTFRLGISVMKYNQWEYQERLIGTVEEYRTNTHLYVLFFDPIENMFKVVYLEGSTDKAGHKLWTTKEQAKDWVEQVHVPAKEL